MYNAKFVNSKGRTFWFGYQYGNIFDIDGLTGHDVVTSMSQGFNQIGETVESLSIKSRVIEIKGRLLGDATKQKKEILNVFAPFETGRLFFENKYYLDCVVKYTPLITFEKRNPLFELVLTAPFPYWQNVDEKGYVIGGYIPKFKFPVDYSEPHTFGVPISGALINAFNGGDVEAYFKITFRSKGSTKNPKLVNVNTQEYLKLNTTILANEQYSIYRNGGKLVVEKETDGMVEDAFKTLDEDSNFLTIHVGDNVIGAFADENENLLLTTITFNDAVVGVYEGI